MPGLANPLTDLPVSLPAGATLWRGIALGLLAFAGVFALNRVAGPGFDPDSMTYVGQAANLVHTGKLYAPYADWWDADSTSRKGTFPPGFSLATSVPMLFGVSGPSAATQVEAISAMVGVTTLVWLVEGLAGLGAGLLAAGLALATPAFIELHFSTLSEPLFLALLVVTLTAMVRSPERPLRYGVLAALASMVRYVGVGVPAAAVVWAFAQPVHLKVRVQRAILAGIPALILNVIWLIRCSIGTDHVPLGLDSLDTNLSANLEEARAALGEWLAPSLSESKWETPLAALVALALLVLMVRLALRLPWRRWPEELVTRFFLAAGLLGMAHIGVLVYSRILVGHEIPFDSRLLSPLFLLGDTAIAVSVALNWPRWSGWQRGLTMAALALWFVGAGFWLRDDIEDVRENGWDYNSYAWRASPLVLWLRGQGQDYQLFSNNPVPIYFQVGRPSREVPMSTSPDTVAAFGRALAEHHGALIGFSDTTWLPAAHPDSLARRLGLREVARFDEGTVWLPNP
jgi:hypothetical protein